MAVEEEREGTVSCNGGCHLKSACPAMFALMLVLLWVGVVCLCYRQLHQTSTLSVGVMEGSYRDMLECTEEDITDKVRAALSTLSWSMQWLTVLRDPQAGGGLKLLLLPSWPQVDHCGGTYGPPESRGWRIRVLGIQLQRSCAESGGGTGGFSWGWRCAVPLAGRVASLPLAGSRAELFAGCVFTSSSCKKMFSNSAFLR